MTETPERAAARQIEAGLTGRRDLGDQIEAIATALMIERDRRSAPRSGLTQWERGFIVPIIDRWVRYQDRIQLSQKQIAVIGRIHDKIKHRLVI